MLTQVERSLPRRQRAEQHAMAARGRQRREGQAAGDQHPRRRAASSVRQQGQAAVPGRILAGPHRLSRCTDWLGLRLEVGLEVVQHQQDRLVLQGAGEVARQTMQPTRAGELRIRVPVDCIGGPFLHMLVVADQLFVEPQVDVAKRGLEAQRIRLGLVDQHPLEPRFPKCQHLGGQCRLAHAAQAGDDRHGLHLGPVAGADELRTQTGQFPRAANELRVSRRGQLGDLVQPGTAGSRAGLRPSGKVSPGCSAP